MRLRGKLIAFRIFSVTGQEFKKKKFILIKTVLIVLEGFSVSGSIFNNFLKK